MCQAIFTICSRYPSLGEGLGGRSRRSLRSSLWPSNLVTLSLKRRPSGRCFCGQMGYSNLHFPAIFHRFVSPRTQRCPTA